MIGHRQIRQRIAAKNRSFFRIDKQPQDNKLTRLEHRKSLPIDRRQNEGSHVIAFLMDIRDSHLSKAGPGRCLCLIRESSISLGGFRARLLLKYRLKRRLPTLAQGWDA